MENYKGRFYSVLFIVLSISSVCWYFYKLDTSFSKIGTLWIVSLSIIVLYLYIKALILISNNKFFCCKEINENSIIHNDINVNSVSYFIKNDFIKNQNKSFKQITNNFINQISEKEVDKNNTDSDKKFNDEFIKKIINVIKDLEIKEVKHFSILICFIKEKFYPLKTDVWLLEKFKSNIEKDIKPQNLSAVKNELEEIKGIKELNNLTRAQTKSYNLLQKIDEYFNAYNEK